MELDKVVNAITRTMQCDKCPYPYPCEEKEDCGKHWTDMLTGLVVDR